MLKKFIYFGGLYLFLAGSAISYFVLTGKLTNQNSILDPVRIAEGKILYEQNCAACHGINLKGEPNWEVKGPDGIFPAPPQNEDGHTWQHTDRQIFGYIVEGGGYFNPPAFQSNMPGFKDKLTSAQIWALITYVKSRWPEEIRKKQNATNFTSGFGHH